MRCCCALILALLTSSCASWKRAPGEWHYTTPFPFTKPSPADPLANLDPAHPAHALGLPEQPATPPATATTPLADHQPRLPTAIHRTTTKGIALTILTFDDRDLSLQVVDKSGGPDTEWQSAQAAARAHQAVAAINASFFTPGGKPLGLVIENGIRFGSWTRSSSLTSGVLAVRHGRPELRRREAWPSTQAADHLVQAGPFLLEAATAVAGLSTSPKRARSFVAWDGRHHWMLGHARNATLAELSAALASQPLRTIRLSTALNLDGGRSSDLWAASTIPGGPTSTRRIWNNPVRNYVLLRRSP